MGDDRERGPRANSAKDYWMALWAAGLPLGALFVLAVFLVSTPLPDSDDRRGRSPERGEGSTSAETATAERSNGSASSVKISGGARRAEAEPQPTEDGAARQWVTIRVADAETSRPVPGAAIAWLTVTPDAMKRLRPKILALPAAERDAMANAPELWVRRFGARVEADPAGELRIEVEPSPIHVAVASDGLAGHGVFFPGRSEEPWMLEASSMRALRVQLDRAGVEAAPLAGVPVVLEGPLVDKGWYPRFPLGVTDAGGKLVSLDSEGLSKRVNAIGVQKVRLRVGAPGSPPTEWLDRVPLLADPPPTIRLAAPVVTGKVRVAVRDVEGELIDGFRGWLTVEDRLGMPWRYQVSEGGCELPRVVRDTEFDWIIQADDAVVGRVTTAIRSTGEPQPSEVDCVSTAHRVCYVRILGVDGRPLSAGTKVGIRWGERRSALGVRLRSVAVDAEGRVRVVLPAREAGVLHLFANQAEAVCALAVGKPEALRLTAALQANVDLLVLEPVDPNGALVEGAEVELRRDLRGLIRSASRSRGEIALRGSPVRRGQKLAGRIVASGFCSRRFEGEANGGRERIRLERATELEIDVALADSTIAQGVTVALVRGKERLFASKVERRGSKWVGSWSAAPLGRSRAVVFAKNPVHVLTEFEVDLDAGSDRLQFDCTKRPWRLTPFEVALPAGKGPAFLFMKPLGDPDGFISQVGFREVVLTDGKSRWLLFGQRIQGVVRRFASTERERIAVRTPPRVRWRDSAETKSWRLVPQSPGFSADRVLPWVTSVNEDSFYPVDLPASEYMGEMPDDRLLFPCSYTVEVDGGRAIPSVIDHPAPPEVLLQAR